MRGASPQIEALHGTMPRDIGRWIADAHYRIDQGDVTQRLNHFRVRLSFVVTLGVVARGCAAAIRSGEFESVDEHIDRHRFSTFDALKLRF